MAGERRLIDATALSEALYGIGHNIKRPREVELACHVLIADAPTVDAVEVVHAKWEFNETGYQCSKCKWSALYDGWNHPIRSKFCPSCGAKMDGGVSNGI